MKFKLTEDVNKILSIEDLLSREQLVQAFKLEAPTKSDMIIKFSDLIEATSKNVITKYSPKSFQAACKDNYAFELSVRKNKDGLFKIKSIFTYDLNTGETVLDGVANSKDYK